MGRSRRAPQQHDVQQLMRAVSRCQLTYEAEHGLVLCVNMEYGLTVKSKNSSVRWCTARPAGLWQRPQAVCFVDVSFIYFFIPKVSGDGFWRQLPVNVHY